MAMVLNNGGITDRAAPEGGRSIPCALDPEGVAASARGPHPVARPDGPSSPIPPGTAFDQVVRRVGNAPETTRHSSVTAPSRERAVWTRRATGGPARVLNAPTAHDRIVSRDRDARARSVGLSAGVL